MDAEVWIVVSVVRVFSILLLDISKHGKDTNRFEMNGTHDRINSHLRYESWDVSSDAVYAHFDLGCLRMLGHVRNDQEVFHRISIPRCTWLL